MSVIEVTRVSTSVKNQFTEYEGQESDLISCELARPAWFNVGRAGTRSRRRETPPYEIRRLVDRWRLTRFHPVCEPPYVPEGYTLERWEISAQERQEADESYRRLWADQAAEDSEALLGSVHSQSPVSELFIREELIYEGVTDWFRRGLSPRDVTPQVREHLWKAVGFDPFFRDHGWEAVHYALNKLEAAINARRQYDPSRMYYDHPEGTFDRAFGRVMWLRCAMNTLIELYGADDEEEEDRADFLKDVIGEFRGDEHYEPIDIRQLLEDAARTAQVLVTRAWDRWQREHPDKWSPLAMVA